MPTLTSTLTRLAAILGGAPSYIGLMTHRDQDKPQRRGRRPARRAVAVASVAIVMVGCGGDDSSTTAASSTGADFTSTTVEAVPATATPSALPKLVGHLMFSRFDESTHTFVSTHISAADGSGEVELAVPDEGGGRWSHSGNEIAVSTVLDDGRIGTAIITPDGTVERVLTIPDPTLNLPCIFGLPTTAGWPARDGSTATRLGRASTRPTLPTALTSFG